MRSGLAARVACFSVARNRAAAASCRGSLEGLGRKRVEQRSAPAAPEPEIEIVRPEPD
jgi:hypothetical protein